jgi:ADP-heptose:LPS heptosyltransferase
MQIFAISTYKRPEGIGNILLVHLGHIGDVVWTTLSIGAVKNTSAKVSFLVKERIGSLWEADPSLDQIFEVKRYRGNIFSHVFGQLSFLKRHPVSTF